MPPRQQPQIVDASAIPYRSTACRTHLACKESSPVSAPIDLPVVYETCACPCHSASHHSTPPEVEQ
ncbi:hypothetical protein ABZ636_13630 [Streptomyces sp. NPDC007251]|uniref:hypothetical protein n=1 Tax=Streptomyces sp. NPDC007251 TaxID=3154483 RepID=UPI0034020F64